MGKGIAKEFREAVPGLFEAYAARCASGELTVGRLHLHRAPHKWVLNFPTKRHWRAPSRLEDVEPGLVAFTERHETHGIASAAFPQLGCGHGGLVLATREAPAVVVAPFQYSQMIWGVLFGVLLFADRPEPVLFLGMAIVVASGLYTIWRETARQRPVTLGGGRGEVPARAAR